MRFFFPDVNRPQGTMVEKRVDDFNLTYTSWADLAEKSRASEKPISLSLFIDSTSYRADWRGLKRTQHVRLLQIRLATPLTQTLADSLIGALAGWPELDNIHISASLPGSPTASGIAPQQIDGKASARLASVRRLNFSLSGDPLRAAIQLFSYCPSVFHVAINDYKMPASTLPDELRNLTTVRSFSMYGPGHVSMEKIIGRFPALTALELAYTGDWQQLTTDLKKVPNLRRLSLTAGQGQSRISGLRLGSLTKLDTLNLRLNQGITEPVDSLLIGLTSLQVVEFADATLSSLAWMGENTGLRQVNLFRCRFPVFSESLARLTQLESIALNQADSLKQFPVGFTTVPNLRYLSIHNSGITAIPATIGTMTSLTALTISGSKLRNVPDEIGQLTGLRLLSLTGNQLTSLPASLSRLDQLTALELATNQLTSLPVGVGRLRQLRTLALARNKLTALPDELGQCRQLTELNLNDNPLTALPESIGNLDSLRTLTMTMTRLRSLPSTVGKLKQLRWLNVSGSRLTSLPESLGNCQNLVSLDISDSTLTSLPASINRLGKLSGLSLELTQLQMLPASVASLTNVRTMRLNTPQLVLLPDEIGNLTSLTWLSVSSSKLMGLPNSIGRLKQLTNLTIDGKVEPITNKPTGMLEYFPDSLVRCDKLTDLTITNQIAFDGVDAIRKTARMPSLQSLRLDRCGMDRLTDIDWKTVRLRTLSLQQNSLRDVPESILDAPNLQSINLYYNYPLPRALNQNFWNKEGLKTAFVEAQLATSPAAVDKPDARIMQAYMNAGMRQMQQRNWGEVFANMEKAILAAPDTLKAMPLAQRAELYMIRKEYALAVADYEMAIAAAPRLVDRQMGMNADIAKKMMIALWRKQLGTARSALGQYDKALSDLNKAIELLPKEMSSPFLANFYTEQARVNANRNKPDEARKSLDKANEVYAGMLYAGPGERLTEVELAILTNQPDKATAALTKYQKQFMTSRPTGFDTGGYNTLYEYLASCTAILSGSKTPEQAQTALATYLKTTPGKIYNWSFDLFETMLPRIGLSTEKVAALGALTKLTKEQAVKME
ncbi:leucine-rich repeat domain-containing protein [Fibrella forsythiae]|uniref:Disease resistance R13L4/SHOC-2-like LRR domain-containing protein n=1 Tax=Fibrella forsythiae TaxID=2817061 RepID=A0ABS3JDK0_9BACT|nr:hypothetical protein [Fibrella forsythiae]MBO0948063.1 hypothetical protein [Fibrella forsythiae]